MVGEFAGVAVVLVGVVLAVAVPVAHPGLADAACCATEDAVRSPRGALKPGRSPQSCLTGVPAAELDSRVAHVCHALAVLLVAQVHAVRVPVAAPAQGDAQAVHPALELIGVAASGGASGCRERMEDTFSWIRSTKTDVYKW